MARHRLSFVARLGLPVLFVAALLPLGRAAGSPALVRRSGYLTMADGVELRYTVVGPGATTLVRPGGSRASITGPIASARCDRGRWTDVAGVRCRPTHPVFPFGTMIRKGSRLRLWVEAPTTLPELWSFPPAPYPAIDEVLHDPAHVSSLVLPLVANDPNRIENYPACNTVIRQPCRPDPLAP